jgi:hypothetical protein
VTTTIDPSTVTDCYWCEKPIDQTPGGAVVGLSWVRRPRAIIEPDATSATVAEVGGQPRRRRRFEWGFVNEFAYAHVPCAEEAVGGYRGCLIDRYEFPWGGAPEPTADESAESDSESDSEDASIVPDYPPDWGEGEEAQP